MSVNNALPRLLAILKRILLSRNTVPAATSSLITAALMMSFNFMSGNKTIGRDGNIVEGNHNVVGNIGPQMSFQWETYNIDKSVTRIENSINEISQEIKIIGTLSNRNEVTDNNNFEIKNSASKVEMNIVTIQDELGKLIQANQAVKLEQPAIYSQSGCYQSFIPRNPFSMSKPRVVVPPNGSQYWADEWYMGAW